eukprot:CAMPEP_0197073128 /NCGR_PEP_ID=MMETSP1384-20130603/210450_1 /TAXON_ID=29189 /ORGANISM="Ammonia sp." /LENGTH=450 /DNA_ID=CAMNT_0042511959 /DNA_START=58 /DNA_END=1410 /DNA_ORIENTATION=+
MADESSADTEVEEEQTALRYEWLDTLRREELRTLCQNRCIDTDASTKTALISSILKHKPSSATTNYDRCSKPTLLLELRAIGMNKPAGSSKAELIECLNENTAKKPSKQTLADFSVSELQKLCQRRKIHTKKKDLSSKKSLIKLLEESGVADPKYTDAMTNKQLIAEMKGRGLSFSQMKKEEMIETLNSGIFYEEQKLKQHVDANNVNHVIDRARVALAEFIEYVKENKDIIQKCTKINTLKNSKKADEVYGTDWRKMEGVLRNMREELYESRAMLEAYGGSDFGRDETMPQEFIEYVKENKDIIQKCTKINTLKNSKKADEVYGTDWRKMEGVLRNMREELYESRAMLEAYGGSDFGRDETMPHLERFPSVVNYENDADVYEEDLVYVVYDEDEDLIMKQSKRAILAVFQSEAEAEKFRKKQQKQDKEMEVAIQEVEMNEDFGAEPVAI